MKIGLKLYSTDVALAPKALDLHEKGVFDYIEIYIVPFSYRKTIEIWRNMGIPYVVHAPHIAHYINLANCELRESNMKSYREVKEFCNSLESPFIIVHGGSDGTIEETIAQLKIISDNRIRLENKPMKGIGGEQCRCCSPEEFEKVYDAGVLFGTALDFGHAIYYSAYHGFDYRNVIGQFLKYSPSVFHLSDGMYSSSTDIHLNIGKGEFNIRELLSFIPQGAMLSLETPRFSKENLDEFVNDVRFLQQILNEADSDRGPKQIYQEGEE